MWSHEWLQLDETGDQEPTLDKAHKILTSNDDEKSAGERATYIIPNVMQESS